MSDQSAVIPAGADNQAPRTEVSGDLPIATAAPSTPLPYAAAYVPTTVAARPLRVALLLDSMSQPAWVERALAELLQTRAVTLAVVVLNSAAPEVTERLRPLARVRRWYRNRRYLLAALYRRFDAWHNPVADDPLLEKDVTSLLSDVPVYPLRPRQTRHCDYFADEDVAALRALDLDVAVRLGFRILKGDALRIARFGVWSYHHGDNQVNRGGPPGFWEVMEGADVTGSVLQVLTEDLDDGQVLYRSFASTHRWSVRQNCANYYWKSGAFLRRKLEELHRDLPDRMPRVADSGNPEWHAYSNRLYVEPTNAVMSRLLARLIGRYLAEKWLSFWWMEQWFVGYRLAPRSDRPADVPDGTLYRFRELVPPRDRFWADPFPVAYGDRLYLFVEELIFSEDKGRIIVFEIDEQGRAGSPSSALERDYHISYPFVFEWNGVHYMIPETEGRRRVELFRARRFPFDWEFDRVLLDDTPAVDATLAEVDGRWWMFANVAIEHASSWDELYLFHAPSPLGPWTPHTGNPVKSDVRSARPAGRLFVHNGVLYRPAQDCARRYGHAIVVNAIEELTPTSFRERPVERIEPSWAPGLVATHTINAAGGLTAVDAQRRRPRFWRG